MSMECQSCGKPMECAEDHADCQLEQQFCNYCMVSGEFTVKNREEMKKVVSGRFKDTMDMVDPEAESRAEELLSRLERWKNA